MKTQVGYNRSGAISLLPTLTLIINRMGWAKPYINPVRDVGLHFQLLRFHAWFIVYRNEQVLIATGHSASYWFWFRACQRFFQYFVNPVHDWSVRIWDKLFHKPIYYEYNSIDCDCCETYYCDVYLHGEKAFRKYCEHRIEWADGPMSWTRITKAEYEEWKMITGGRSSHRDRVMEAYENGRGSSIVV